MYHNYQLYGSNWIWIKFFTLGLSEKWDKYWWINSSSTGNNTSTSAAIMIISSWLLLFLFFLLALLLFECLLCARSFAEHFYDSISFNPYNNPKVATMKVNSLSSPFVWGHKYSARTWIQTQVWLGQSSCSCSLHNWYLAYHYSEGERWFFFPCLPPHPGSQVQEWGSRVRV